MINSILQYFLWKKSVVYYTKNGAVLKVTLYTRPWYSGNKDAYDEARKFKVHEEYTLTNSDCF